MKKTILLLVGFLGSNLSVIASDSPNNRLNVPKPSRKYADSPEPLHSPKPFHAPKTQRLSQKELDEKIKQQIDLIEQHSLSAAPAAQNRAFIGKRVSPARHDGEKLDITK